MVVNYNMVVDFARENKSNTILVAEDDANSRNCRFTLLFDKAPFDMTGVRTAEVRAIKPSGAVVIGTATLIVDEDEHLINQIEYLLPAALTDESGTVTITITLADNVGAKISSFDYYLKVRNALYNEDDYIDDDDMAGFRDLLNRTRAALERMEQMVQNDALPNPYPIRITVDGVEYEYTGEDLVEIFMGKVAYWGEPTGLVEVTEDDSAAAVAVAAAEAAADSKEGCDDVLAQVTEIANNLSITATASVDNNTGIPSVTVTKTGTNANPNFDFAFSNLKGSGGGGGSASWGSISGTLSDQTDLQTALNAKQDTMSEGDGIDITSNTISVDLDYLTGSRLGLAEVATSGSYNDLTDQYELPIAGANTLGGIKVGTNLSIDENGVLSASGGGGAVDDAYKSIKVGSSTMSASGEDTFEIIAGSNVTLTPGTKSVTISAAGGGQSTGDMLASDYDSTYAVKTAGGIVPYVASQAYTLPTAGAQTLGGVKVGSNLSIDGNGVLSATGGASYSEGDGIDITNNTISLDMDYLMGSNVALQHVTLDTPIEMLSGTKLTVETALQGLNSEKMTYKDNGILGAKNLLKVRDFTSITLQGITFTKQSNDTILMNGTNDGTEVTYLTLNNLVVPAGDYILSKGFTNANVKLSADAYNDSSWVKKLATSVNDDEVDLSVDYSGYDRVRFQFIIEKNTVVSNITAYPMLRLASDTDSTYRPYAMTNKELTDKVNEGIPTASASVLGGIKVGSGLSIDGSGVLSASGGGSSAWGSITGNLSSQTDLFDDLKGAETELRDTVGFTCKNRLPITLAMLKSKNTTGTWSDNAYTINGITYTVDYNLTDGYINKITANGTATGSALLTLLDNYTGSDIVQGKKYILNGCPDANNKCHITFYLYDGQSSAAMNTAYTSADVVMDLNYSYQSYARYMYIGIDQGYTASNVEFKPMIRKYGVADPTYERYYANVQSHLNHIDEWTPSQSVVNGQITFGGLDDTQGWGYKPYFNTYGQTNKNPSYTINSTSGEGTSNMSITYDTDADNGSYVKLRIIK